MPWNAEGATFAGAYGLVNVPDALWKYDKDKDYAGFLLYTQRGNAQFTYLLREAMAKQKVDSHEPVLPAVSELEWKFYCSGNSARSSAALQDIFKFADADAVQLQKDDMFINTVLFYNGSAYTATESSTNSDPEQIRIMTVGSAGSGGGTDTLVTVRRGWGYSIPATPTQVTSAMALMRALPVSGEGSRSRIAISKNITTETTYVQLFRMAYEATDFEMDEDLEYGEEVRPEQVNANLALGLLAKEMEISFWVNKEAKVVDPATGRLLYTTGGIMPYIPKDSTHRINYNGVLTIPGMNNLLTTISKNGGSAERWAFCGLQFHTALCNVFESKIRLMDGSIENWGMKIHQFDGSSGITLNLLPSYMLTELGKDWSMYILDFGDAQTPYLQYIYMEDLHINQGANGNGIQGNDERIRKEEFVGQIGLLRRASTYQHYVYGVTQVSI
jgi:hypothetical protein